MAPTRIGLIVPSSNVTMETELPQIFGRESGAFSFHSSRVRMRTVRRDELEAMNAQMDRAVEELADAGVDALAYACLIALAVEGPGAHERAERRLQERARARGLSGPIVSSLGALLAELDRLSARRVALVAPYLPELTGAVILYLKSCGVEVVDAVSLSVANNLEVAALNPARLPDHARQLNLAKADAVVLSACVQMPSLSAIAEAERVTGLPVVTAASATALQLLRALGHEPQKVSAASTPPRLDAGPSSTSG